MTARETEGLQERAALCETSDGSIIQECATFQIENLKPGTVGEDIAENWGWGCGEQEGGERGKGIRNGDQEG